jgi:hypothetical protein
VKQNDMPPVTDINCRSPDTDATSLSVLMTHERWFEVGRILVSGLVALLD